VSRINELARVLKDRVDTMERFASNAIKVDGTNVELKSADAAQYKKLHNEALEIKELIDIEKFGVQQKDWIKSLDEAGPSAAMSALAGAPIPNRIAMQSLGTLFTESTEFKDFAHSLGDTLSGPATMRSSFETEQYDIVRNVGMSSRGVERKDVYGAMDSSTITRGIGTVVQFDPMIPRQQRPSRVRDLFPQATTTANLIDYFQVLGFAENDGDGNAQTVADYNSGQFGLKPQSKLKFKAEQAPVRTIAHWEAAHRNVIMDVPQLQATINNELLYGLALQEDWQLLQGDGNTENIKGILNHEGIQVYTAENNELYSDSLRKASTLAMLANYPPNGYVLHPYDWEKIEIQKGTGDGQYMLFTNIAIGVNAQVWRQPVVETAAMQQGTFLTGAFGAGAQVYDRMRASIRIAEQHADFFVRNAVVILCEERLALAVKRPEAFVKGTFDQ
jgi:HK97 family phage major capsid protein